MNKLRLSHSLIDIFNRDKQDFIDYITGVERVPSDAQIEGTAWDKLIKGCVAKYGKLPAQFGGIEVKHPILDEKWEVDMGDFVLVYKPDLRDGETVLYEFKTGKTPLSSYMASWQLPIGLLVAKKLGMNIDKGILIKFDQHGYGNVGEWFQINNNEKLYLKTEGYLMTKADEIAEFMKNNNLEQKIWTTQTSTRNN